MAEDFSLLWDFLEASQGDPRRLRSALADVPRQTLRAFHAEFQEAVEALWCTTVEDVARCRFPDSEDAVKDLFIATVACGKEHYRRTFARPETLPSKIEMSLVELYGVAGQVLWERFGEEIGIPEWVNKPEGPSDNVRS